MRLPSRRAWACRDFPEEARRCPPGRIRRARARPWRLLRLRAWNKFQIPRTSVCVRALRPPLAHDLQPCCPKLQRLRSRARAQVLLLSQCEVEEAPGDELRLARASAMLRNTVKADARAVYKTKALRQHL